MTTAGVVKGRADAEPPVELLAEHAATAEQEQQRDAADDGREHQRHRDQGAHQRAPGELRPGQHPRQRDAEDEADQRCAGRADE